MNNQPQAPHSHEELQQFAGYTPTWCSGCGNWGIAQAVKRSFTSQGLKPSSVALAIDIGCSGNTNDFINAYAMHTLHGRAVATGVGMKLGNHALPVVVIGGDGALYGEGGNHLLHACRGNHDITVLVHDNSIYGLTTGQASPTSRKGMKSKSTPQGLIEHPATPLLLALSQGATFVAQAFANNLDQLSSLLTQAMQHPGTALINVLQPCVTFNRVSTYQYYFERAYNLGEDHDPADFQRALQLAAEPINEKFPLGILYQTTRPTYHQQVPTLEKTPLVNQPRIKVTDSILNSFR